MSLVQVHDPRPGWETRWLRQAGVLAFRNGPLCLALLAMMIVPGFIANHLEIRFVSLRVLLETAIWTSLVALPFCVWMARAILRREGYAAPAFGMEDLKSLVPSMFLSCLAMTLPALVILAIEGLATQPEGAGGYLSTLPLMAIPLVLGTRMAMFLMVRAAMPEWSTLECDQVAGKAATVFGRRVWRPRRVLILSMVCLCAVLPFLAAGPLAVLGFFWFYVSAREIIGGVDGNRESSSRTSLALASASA